jgi:pimeloyl-ACP methyl ester carboxylesterase
MTTIHSNGLEFEVVQHGETSDPAVVLVMGLAAQLTRWPEAFVQALADSGFRVICFDNRDIGLSQKLAAKRAPSPVWVSLLNLLGLADLAAPYKLTDMAADTIGIMDALNIEDAHIVGASMGGMISQILCAENPQRVKSLTAIMSSTNNPALPRADPSISKEVFFARNNAANREELIENTLRLWQLIGTKDGGRDEIEFRQLVADSVDRNSSPAGIRRQLAAIIATRDLRTWTRRIEASSLIIHGSDDPLVPLACGQDIAASIDGARMEIIEGMGHDLPPRHLTEVTAHVLEHLHRCEKEYALYPGRHKSSNRLRILSTPSATARLLRKIGSMAR